ncbi:type II secretion system protein [Candidatus Omnitrophota bacterium]
MNRKAFTLVEILVVMAILTSLAALAIPLLLRARHNANEAAAIVSLKQISKACISFYSTQTPTSYPANLAVLGAAVPPYINSTLAGATAAATARQGYFYTYALVNANQFTCTATPALSGTTGSRIFFVDETAVIRLNNVAGPPIE